ncbi:unnamed protein product [Arctia plantaginis]|uniref:Uncharacterized protein n=1 Tax=Arctia plantaginis TaxID=874455 RepID=A0A8S1ADD8_ARCPL|nr:unnamed protein product [Arctia plantaginis]
MEVDSMHSAIEKEQRHSAVYSMIDWKSIMIRARSKRQRNSAPPYKVHELHCQDMLDVRAINEAFIKNINKDKNGDKEDPECQYGKTVAIATRRWEFLEKKLQKNPSLNEEYHKVLVLKRKKPEGASSDSDDSVGDLKRPSTSKEPDLVSDSSINDCNENVIGKFIGQASMLSTEMKKELLDNTWSPSATYDFAEDAKHLKRKFKYSWLETYSSWLA